MSSPPTISVVIPAYQAAGFITRALDSIHDQIVRPSEVVIVVDGSTDATAERAEEWSRQHPDLAVKVIRQPNGGPASARNHGILVSQGEFVAFLDADDRFLPTHLHLLSAALLAHPDAGFAFAGMSGLQNDVLHTDNLLEGAKHLLARYGQRSPHADGVLLVDKSFRAEAACRFVMPPSCWMVRRRLFARAGLFETGRINGEDILQFFQMLSEAPAACIETATAEKHGHGANLTDPSGRRLADSELLGVFHRIWSEIPPSDVPAKQLLAVAVAKHLKDCDYHESGLGLREFSKHRMRVRQLAGLSGFPPIRAYLRAIRHSLG